MIEIVISLIAEASGRDEVALTCCEPPAGGEGGRGAQLGVKGLCLGTARGVSGDNKPLPLPAP